MTKKTLDDPTKNGMTVIDHILHPNYKLLFPEDAITVLSVANSKYISISDSSFGFDKPTDEHIDMRTYIRDCLLFRMWHEDYCIKRNWRFDRELPDKERFEDPLGTCNMPDRRVAMIYYEKYQGMLRGSYDALYYSCHSLKRWCEQGSDGEKDLIKIRFPYSVRSGLNRAVFSSMVKSVFKHPRYDLEIMGLTK